jgi:uncharacterized membrane protein YphA (DoxX/SURF4 family)
VYTGALFLDAVQWKVLEAGLPLDEAVHRFVAQEYEPLVRHAIAHPPELWGWRLDAYSDFLSAVMLPGASVLGPLVLLFEALLGVSLVLGAGVRGMALGGALLMLAFGLAKGLYFLTVSTGTNWLLMVVLLALALTGAGRIWGLDAWLRPRLPRWLRWAS